MWLCVIGLIYKTLYFIGQFSLEEVTRYSGARNDAARMAANLSSKQAANRLGQTELCLKQMEAGSRRVSAGTPARAAPVIHVPAGFHTP